MAEMRDISLPEHFFQYPDMAEIDRVTELFMSELYDDIADLHDDILIMTATERGIARREAILGITPETTETLEARRARVLMKWYERSPYTRKVIERKIAALCGAGNYSLDYDDEDMILHVEMSGVEWDVIDAVHETLEDMVRLMIILDIKRIYVSAVETTVHCALAHIGTIDFAVPIEAVEEG